MFKFVVFAVLLCTHSGGLSYRESLTLKKGLFFSFYFEFVVSAVVFSCGIKNHGEALDYKLHIRVENEKKVILLHFKDIKFNYKHLLAETVLEHKLCDISM